MIENPFITYGYESAEYFCDRESETEQLISLLVNGNHTALISPRRMGKTGLIRHCFADSRLSEHYYTFLVDIYTTKALQDMVYQLGHGIGDIKSPAFTLEEIFSYLQSVERAS